jgi:hypothetical protein
VAAKTLCRVPKFVVEVHLPLILRISVKNPHDDVINPQKKIYHKQKIHSVRLAFFYEV